MSVFPILPSEHGPAGIHPCQSSADEPVRLTNVPFHEIGASSRTTDLGAQPSAPRGVKCLVPGSPGEPTYDRLGSMAVGQLSVRILTKPL